MKPQVKAFFDKMTWTLTYVVWDPATKDAVLIDPVWDYDPASSKVSTESVDQAIQFLQDQGLKLHYVLETHAHADHLSGAQLIKQKFPQVKVAIGKTITKVQEVFKGVFNLGSDFRTDGSQFDLLLSENETLVAGSLKVETIATPGHTPACSSYLIGDAVFTGDALFMPDYGTGRCDFPAGSAADLYTSVHDKLYKLPPTTRVFVGHDYQPGGRHVAFETTIQAEKSGNIHIKDSTTQQEFVKFRTERDRTLAAPRLLLQSVQVNINGGTLPTAEENGTKYLKIPVR